MLITAATLVNCHWRSLASLSFSGFSASIIGLTFDHQLWGLYILTLGTAGPTAFYIACATSWPLAVRMVVFILRQNLSSEGGSRTPKTKDYSLICFAIPAVRLLATGLVSMAMPMKGAPESRYSKLLSKLIPGLRVIPVVGLVAYVSYCRVDAVKPPPPKRKSTPPANHPV